MSSHKPLALLTCHAWLVGHMDAIHSDTKDGTGRALGIMKAIGQLKLPKQHVGEVREAMNFMIRRLGRANGKRFSKPHQQAIINRAYRALDQNEAEQPAAAEPGMPQTADGGEPPKTGTPPQGWNSAEMQQ